MEKTKEQNSFTTMDNPIRALSWKQPYAQLMLNGKIETRTWYTKYRGYVLICSSKKPYTWKQVLNISATSSNLLINNINIVLFTNRLQNGHAIAIGKLVNCRRMQPEDEEKCFVKYHPDLFCHIYEDVKPIVPFPWKGTQGWKKVSNDIRNKIQFL